MFTGYRHLWLICQSKEKNTFLMHTMWLDAGQLPCPWGRVQVGFPEGESRRQERRLFSFLPPSLHFCFPPSLLPSHFLWSVQNHYTQGTHCTGRENRTKSPPSLSFMWGRSWATWWVKPCCLGACASSATYWLCYLSKLLYFLCLHPSSINADTDRPTS